MTGQEKTEGNLDEFFLSFNGQFTTPEQDHRAIKRRTKPIMGFQVFNEAEPTIAGIELHHMLKKGQYASPANNTGFESLMDLFPAACCVKI